MSSFSDQIDFFNVIPYAEVYGTHPRFLAATSEGFLHTSNHCDPYTSKSGSVMQARHAKVNNCHDHAAIHRYRQLILDKLASSKHKIAHKLGGHRSKFTTHVSDDHRLGDNSDVVQHISYDSSISNVATSNKDESKSDDATRHYNSRTKLLSFDHSFFPSGAKGASRLTTALNSANSAENKAFKKTHFFRLDN